MRLGAGGGGGGVTRLVDRVGLSDAGQSQGLGGLRVELCAAEGRGLGVGGLGGLAGLHLLGDGGLALAGVCEVLGVAEGAGELLAGAAGLAQMAVAAPVKLPGEPVETVEAVLELADQRHRAVGQLGARKRGRPGRQAV